MSGPNPTEPDANGSDLPDQQPGKHAVPEEPTQVAGTDPETGETEFYSQAYSAPESEQYTAGPYVPADLALYDYDSYDPASELVEAPPPRWPWVVGVTAIIAAIALVASVALLVARDDETSNLATPRPSTTTPSAPPVQDEITTTTPPPPPPPPSEELPPSPPPETVTIT
ncbi:hypothetical protein KL858_24550, partial [Mycolicibacterium goodii]|nr:hypothetical protein [Mycolicibacterium goodii]